MPLTITGVDGPKVTPPSTDLLVSKPCQAQYTHNHEFEVAVNQTTSSAWSGPTTTIGLLRALNPTSALPSTFLTSAPPFGPHVCPPSVERVTYTLDPAAFVTTKVAYTVPCPGPAALSTVIHGCSTRSLGRRPGATFEAVATHDSPLSNERNTAGPEPEKVMADRSIVPDTRSRAKTGSPPSPGVVYGSVP